MNAAAHILPTPSRIDAEIARAPLPRIPRLYCPFEAGVHPEVAAVQTQSVAWAEEVGLVSGERARARLDASKIGWLVSRAHPHGARGPLQLAADWTTLFCLLDDHIERIEAPAAVAAYLAELFATLRGAPVWGRDPMQRAMADVRRRLAALATPVATMRVEKRVRELFDAFALEAEVRATREIPGHALYLPMREVTVGIHVELALGELVDGIELPETARTRGAIPDLARRASNLVGWANDIYTFEKELRAGEVCNLVAVIARTRSVGIEEAVSRAAAMHDDEARIFDALSGDEATSSRSEGCRRYAALARRWVRGHLDWARETGRYVA
jgi:5-epi-alpha-selinene synthase